ncbi:MAG TPA: GNAT family N-acetyltransferase [Mycobacterium sp.]|nr:GNAT family N-acetyltransferase [Mycobacterium sp.]
MHASGGLVRPASATDAVACLAVYRPYVERTVISWEIDVPTENEMAARIAAAQAGHEWLVLERDRRVIGFACGHALNRLATYQWSTEAGIYLDADHCRSGGGRALYAELLRWVSARGYRRAFAIDEKPRHKNWVLTIRIISGRRSPSERARRDSNP